MFSLFLSPLCNKTFFVSFQNQNDKLHPRRKQPLNNVQPVQDQKIFYFSSCLNVTASPVEFPDICVALVRFLFNNTVNREEQSSSVCCVLVFLIYVGSDSVCIRHVAAGEVSALHSPQVHCDRSWPLQWNSEVLFLWRNVCTSSSATVKKKKKKTTLSLCGPNTSNSKGLQIVTFGLQVLTAGLLHKDFPLLCFYNRLQCCLPILWEVPWP